MIIQLHRKKRKGYFTVFLGLFLIEILIARFVNDAFIRPYLGDFLVVILIYSFLMSISSISVLKGLALVLAFAFSIEFLQLVDIVHLLQQQPSRLLTIILGSSFSGWDLLAYSLGILCTGSLEYIFKPAEESI